MNKLQSILLFKYLSKHGINVEQDEPRRAISYLFQQVVSPRLVALGLVQINA
jgi:hypothetical protein